MAIDFKKLLPKKMRSTKWGEFLEVIQSIWGDFKEDKVDIIFDQFDIDVATDEQLLEIINSYGYHLLSLTGLTSTSSFLKKQVSFLIPKLEYKTTSKCFEYLGIPFGLTSFGLNAIFSFANSQVITVESQEEIGKFTLEPVTALDWGSPNIIYYIDEGTIDYSGNLGEPPFITLDTTSFNTMDNQTPVYITPNPNPNSNKTLDDDTFPFLDMEVSVNMISRIFVFSYYFNFVENEKEFLSVESMKSLNNDVTQMKRATDFPYFESILKISATNDNNETLTTLRNFDGIATAETRSILIGSDINNITKVKIGMGTYNSTLSTSITDIKTVLKEFLVDDMTIKDCGVSCFHARPFFPEGQHFEYITEMGLFNTLNECVFYATFPKINWDVEMMSNVSFEISITS